MSTPKQVVYARTHPYQEQIAAAFRQRGHDVETIKPRKLREYLYANRDTPPDLVICDMNLAVTGHCHELGYHTNIVFHTSRKSSEIIDEILDYDIAECVGSGEPYEKLVIRGLRLLADRPPASKGHAIISGPRNIGKSTRVHRLATSARGGHYWLSDLPRNFDILQTISTRDLRPEERRRIERSQGFFKPDVIYGPEFALYHKLQPNTPKSQRMRRELDELNKRGHVHTRQAKGNHYLTCISRKGLDWSIEHLGAPEQTRCLEDLLQKGITVFSIAGNADTAYRLWEGVEHVKNAYGYDWPQMWFRLTLSPMALLERFERRYPMSDETSARLRENANALFEGDLQEITIKRIGRKQRKGEALLVRGPKGLSREQRQSLLDEEFELTSTGKQLVTWLRDNETFENLSQVLPSLITTTNVDDLFVSEEWIYRSIARQWERDPALEGAERSLADPKSRFG